MSKLITNTTLSIIDVVDVGIEINPGATYTIVPQDYGIWAASSSVVAFVGSGDLVVNDGFQDLSPAQGMGFLQGSFIQKDFVPYLKENNRLKVDVQFTGDQLIKVSSNDQTSGYLQAKTIGTTGKIVLSVLNEGGDEDLQFNIGSDVFDKTVDTSFNIVHTPAGNIAATNVRDAINELDTEKQALSQKGQANGYAPLGADVKIPVIYLPDTVVGAVDYKGTWNANINTPNLVTNIPDKGDYYVVNTSGATSLGGITDWKIGDWAIYNGTIWEKVDNTDQVVSVFGRQGAVVAIAGDYTATQITNTPAGNISATNVQAAINELDAEKQPLDATLTALAAYNTNGILVQTAADTFAGRSIAAGTGISITNANGVAGNPTVTSATPYIDHWHGTTQYNNTQLRKYTAVGTTDANGRVTFNMTQNGLVGGVALFSSVLSVNAIAVDNSGNAIQVPLASIQALTATQCILRFVDGTSTGVLIGGTVVSMQYTGAGYSVYVEMTGVHP